jgi:hypothetical protein
MNLHPVYSMFSKPLKIFNRQVQVVVVYTTGIFVQKNSDILSLKVLKIWLP